MRINLIIYIWNFHIFHYTSDEILSNLLMNTILTKSCSDILTKNMQYSPEQELYLLYDTDSPLAKALSDAYITVLGSLKESNPDSNIHIREFTNPPQPLYRGGMINPDNPHSKEQNRVITTHNIEENIAI